tara:strand:- start:242 stop:637 length:396 start_codon:yes stop_codon:yes gene_type:complete
MSNILSNCSYESYLKDQLGTISNKFKVKVYKRAGSEMWEGFESGIDLRIQIRWEDRQIFEFLVEKNFWYQLNSNKEDRKYMRMWADAKINTLKSGIIKKKSKSTTTKKVYKKSTKNNEPYTQNLFEKMKQK